MITTTKGLMDESTLLKREGIVDNANEYTTTIEYCLADCDGQAHKTGIADCESHFCNKHIHRGAHVALKEGNEAITAIGSFS